jgi:hypothetical protein
MHNHISIQNSENVIVFKKNKYLFVSQQRKLEIDRSQEYSGIIVDGKNPDFARMAIKRVRSNFQPEVYLKPILILNGTVYREQFVQELTDGMIYNFDQLELVESIVEGINLRIKDVQFLNSISIEAQIISKMLSFMYTREKMNLDPIPSVYSNTNFSYPFLSCHFEFKDEHQLFDILEIARSEGLITGDFYDRTYLCSNCKSSRLSMREVCPKCNSSNSETYDVIHHFPCAYVGPETDYKNEIDDQLNCPKCSKQLKHIGVDYDKPSVLHRCKKCLNSFQDYFVHARCMSCSFDNPVESLIPLEINSFSMTRKGEYAAVYGFVSTPKDIEQIIGTVKYDTFKTMAKYEIERIKQTDGSSNIVALNIVNSSHVYSKIGSKAQQLLLKDIVSSIRSSIRSSDMITFHSSSVVLISLNDIPTKIAERLTKDILMILDRLIRNNFTDTEIQLESRVHRVNIQFSADLQIDQIISSF